MRNFILFFSINFWLQLNTITDLKAQEFCDTLVASTGKKIAVRFIEVYEKEISYAICDQPIEKRSYVSISQIKGLIRKGILIPVNELPKAESKIEKLIELFMKKNFHTNIAFIPVRNYYSLSFYYEKIYSLRKRKETYFRFTKFGGGVLPNHFFENGGSKITPFISVQFGLLKGANSHYFEVGGGIILINNIYALSLPVIANIGYRYQSSTGKCMIRSGLNWPEGLYIGLGYCF